MAILGRRDFTRGALAVAGAVLSPFAPRRALADPKKGGTLAYASVVGSRKSRSPCVLEPRRARSDPQRFRAARHAG